MFESLISNFFNFSINNYSQYYNLQERLEILFNNFFFLLILLLIVFILKNKLKIIRNLKYYILIIIWVVWAYRSIYFYVYDTFFSSIAILSDILLICLLSYILGNLIIRNSSVLLKILFGVSLLTLLSSVLVILNLHTIFSKPNNFSHLIFLLFSSLYIYSTELDYQKYLKSILQINKLFYLIIFIPFLPYVFTPAPPDADITSISEIIGYIYQGKNLSNLSTGLINSNIFIRYPIGLPSLAWIYSIFLNLRASEILLLLWILSYVFLILTIIKITNNFNINPWIIILFSLNITINGTYGLKGGQVQEIISYTFGLTSILLLFKNKYFHSNILCATAMIIHPIVSIPFLTTNSFYYIYKYKLYFLSLNKFKKSLIDFSFIFFAFIYLIYLGLGDSDNKSIVKIAIENTSFRIFTNEVIRNINSDTFGLSFFLISIFISYKFRIIEKDHLILFILWILGIFVIDGLFRVLSTGPFHGTFSIIAPWIISIGLTYKLICLINIKNIKIYAITFFIFLWFFKLSPGVSLYPFSVFTTHAEIKISRYIEKNLSNNSLIVNVRPPGEWGHYNFVRGNSSKNTSFARISEHHIKRGYYGNVPNFNQCYETSKLYNNNYLFSKNLFLCLKSFSATHLLVMSRHNADEFVERIDVEPIIKMGENYLYRLEDL